MELLNDDVAVTHLVVLPGAARDPRFDLILCDVAREGADAVLQRLRDLDIERSGSVVVSSVGVSLSDAARRAARAAPGHGTDAVVWDEIAHKTGEETHLTATYSC